MKKTILTALCILLAVTALCGCDAFIKPNNINAEEYLTPVAFAISMTYETSAWDDENPYDRFDSQFLWDSAGWYAAYLYRTENKATLKADEINAFMNASGYDGMIPNIPEGWLDTEYGWLKVAEIDYDFFHHKEMIDSFIGVTMEFTSEFTGNEIKVTLTTHTDGLEANESVYSFTYENGDNKIPYKITGVSLPSRPPFVFESEQEFESQYSEELNFNYDSLFEANKITNLLDLYGNIEQIAPNDYRSYIYTVNSKVRDFSSIAVIDVDNYADGTPEFFGRYNGFVVYGALSEDSQTRYCCMPFDGEEFDINQYDLSNFFAANEKLIYLYSNNDTVTFAGVGENYSTIYTVEYATLALKKYMGYDNNIGECSIVYGEEAEIPDFLDSWEGEMRTVTLSVTTDDETTNIAYEIPLDWDMVAYEMFDAYTAYLDEDNTIPYEYPGDNIDYTIYITNALE